MNIEIPPFYVGQEVVAVRSSPNVGLKKGDEFIVLAIQKFCHHWTVNVGLKIPHNCDSVCCSACNKDYPKDGIMWSKYTFFAPKHQYGYFISMKQLTDETLEVTGVN